jgi:hypothetical protein
VPTDDAGPAGGPGSDAEPKSGRRGHGPRIVRLGDEPPDLARGLADGLAAVLAGLLEALERGPEQRSDPPQLGLEPLLLGASAPRDRPRLRVRLGEDGLRLPARLLAQLLRRALGGDERRPEEPLELLVADEVGLELLDPVGEVGAVAPDVPKLAATSSSSTSTDARR